MWNQRRRVPALFAGRFAARVAVPFLAGAFLAADLPAAAFLIVTVLAVAAEADLLEMSLPQSSIARP